MLALFRSCSQNFGMITQLSRFVVRTSIAAIALAAASVAASSADELHGHPKLGAAWEGFVIEQLISALTHPNVSGKTSDWTISWTS